MVLKKHVSGSSSAEEAQEALLLRRMQILPILPMLPILHKFAFLGKGPSHLSIDKRRLFLEGTGKFYS
jgi:hypothetical protein